MTLQHSPGPWKAAKSHGGFEAYVVDAENWEICVPRTRADTRLIAAAPTMLRLLRVFALPITQLRRLSDGELRAALEETAELVSRLDGDTCPDK